MVVAVAAAQVLVALAAAHGLKARWCNAPVAANRLQFPSFRAEIARCTARHASVPRRVAVLAVAVEIGIAADAEAAAVVAAAVVVDAAVAAAVATNPLPHCF